MPFSNFPIDIATLPQQETLHLHPVSKKFKRVLWFNWTITWLVITGLFVGFLLLPKTALPVKVMVSISAVLLLSAVVHKLVQSLGFAFRAFALREHDIVYQQGWLIRKKEFCPLSRVQHCSVRAGIIERKYGLATLEIFTAGSSGADITIRGLTVQQASFLKESIISKTGEHEL